MLTLSSYCNSAFTPQLHHTNRLVADKKKMQSQSYLSVDFFPATYLSHLAIKVMST